MSLNDILFSEEFMFESENPRDYHGPVKDSHGTSYGNRYQQAPKSKFRDGPSVKSHDKFAAGHNPRFANTVTGTDSDGNTTRRYVKKDNMTKDEKKDYKSTLKKTRDARRYADKVTKDIDKKYGHDSYEAQTAKDAARRHYRKTHESVELYDGLELV